MRKKGKIWLLLAVLFAVYVMPFTAHPAAAAGFPDLPRTHWAYQTIMWANAQGIIKGMPNGHVAPDRLVTQSEFVTMLVRAFVPGSDYEAEYRAIGAPAGAAWDFQDYMFAVYMNWSVTQEGRSKVMTRGQVAELITSVIGLNCTPYGAIQYLLDNGLARGKTTPTIEGFKAGDTLSRAEAATFIYNLYSKGIKIAARSTAPSAVCQADVRTMNDIAVSGIMIHDSEAKLLDTLGEPNLKLVSQYGFEWYVYNADYTRYAQIGVKDGKVVGLLTNADNWTTPDGIGPGSVAREVKAAYGEPLTVLHNYRLSDNGESALYLRGNYYLTVYYDKHDNNRVQAIQLIDRAVEQRMQGIYGQPDDKLAASYERQIFELANASRVRNGLKALAWDQSAASAARKHSRNMAVQRFFDHTDPDGLSPFDRMKREGIEYSAAGENIAYGQKDALEVHVGWMNSEGHRRNLLNASYERLGVGVYLNGEGVPYYTQNFYAPLKLLSLKLN